MSFSATGALLWLIPTGLILFALYLLKMRRKPFEVPATFLWPAQTEEIRANAFFQRPRLNILFWLQLLALVVIAAALAGPQFLTRSLAGRVTMIVLDGSASMRATDVSPSRFEVALDLARQAIGEVKAGDRIGVIFSGAQTEVAIPLTDAPGQHSSKLSELKAQDVSGNMPEALRLAAASVSAYDGARILVISDGAFRPIEQFSLPKGEVVFRSVGRSSRNLGISALGSAVTGRGREVYCAVRNYGLDEASAGITLEADGRVVDSRRIQVKAGGTWGQSFVVPAGARLCRAVLESEDALTADNTRVAAITDSSNLRVLLVGPGDYFLERALALDPRVSLERSARLPAEDKAGVTGPGKYDLVVFSGTDAESAKARGVLVFGGTGSRTISRPEFLSSTDHPAVRGIQFESVYIERAGQFQMVAGAKPIVEARQGPLIVEHETPGKRRLHVAFDLNRSDWPLHPGFPIFIGQALSYLAGEGRLDVATLAAGKPFTVPLEEGAEFAAPEGVRWSRQEGYAIVRGLPRVGEYRLKVGDKTQRYFANLEDPEESKIEPQAFVRLGGDKLARTPTPQRPTDLWKWAVLLGLAVLAVEWWVFVRKS